MRLLFICCISVQYAGDRSSHCHLFTWKVGLQCPPPPSLSLVFTVQPTKLSLVFFFFLMLSASHSHCRPVTLFFLQHLPRVFFCIIILCLFTWSKYCNCLSPFSFYFEFSRWFFFIFCSSCHLWYLQSNIWYIQYKNIIQAFVRKQKLGHKRSEKEDGHK